MGKTTINEYKALCVAILKAYEAIENENTQDYNLKIWRRIYTFMKAITDAYAYIDNNRAVAEVKGFKVSVEINSRKTPLEAAREEYKRQKEFKTQLPDEEKEFFSTIKSVSIDDQYDLSSEKHLLIADAYNNNLINGGLDLYRYGYLQGQRAEKNNQDDINDDKEYTYTIVNIPDESGSLQLLDELAQYIRLQD